MHREPIFDVAHLGHVELFSPKADESLKFFTDILGMKVAKTEGNSVYLRCWGDWEYYSLKLTESKQAGVAHTAMRAISPAALERRAAAIEGRRLGIGWSEGDYGHGKAYQFRDPDGHLFELYYEADRYNAPEALRPTLKNQPEKVPYHGIPVKHLDHVNFLSANTVDDADFMENELGLRLTEQIVLDNGYRPGVWYRATNKSYDLVYTHDATGTRGRLHHIAFGVDTNEGIWKAADLFVDHDIFIEFAPSKHAINQTYFVYVYEPGGNRIEICSGGYLVLAPDWEPISWSEKERARGQAWGNQTVASFHTYGTPVV